MNAAMSTFPGQPTGNVASRLPAVQDNCPHGVYRKIQNLHCRVTTITGRPEVSRPRSREEKSEAAENGDRNRFQ
jgi:hypothetical protein